MKLYYVSWLGCRCCIVKASSIDAAIRSVERDFGRHDGPYRAREATQEDHDWVRSMGGIVPKALAEVQP